MNAHESSLELGLRRVHYILLDEFLDCVLDIFLLFLFFFNLGFHHFSRH